MIHHTAMYTSNNFVNDKRHQSDNITSDRFFFLKKESKLKTWKPKLCQMWGFLQHSFHKLKFSNSCNIFHTVSVASVLHFHQNGGKKNRHNCSLMSSTQLRWLCAMCQVTKIQRWMTSRCTAFKLVNSGCDLTNCLATPATQTTHQA